MLSIGTFSRLGQVSIRMLRHYDAIGLLRPAQVDAESGYRYYEYTQLETLTRIRMFKDYGFPLATIGELLALDGPALSERLHAKRIALYGEMAQLQQTLRRLDFRLGKTEAMIMTNEPEYKVFIMETPAQRIFGLCRHIHIGQVGELFADLSAQIEKRRLTRSGAGLMIYHGEEFSYDNMDVEAAFPVAENHPDTHIMAGGPHVVTMHHGAYEGLQNAYGAIAKWLSEHPKYEITGPSFERYIKDEVDGVPPEQYETGILFPVKKVEKP